MVPILGLLLCALFGGLAAGGRAQVPIAEVARTDGLFAGFEGEPSSEQHGKVIFKGLRRDGRAGIYVRSPSGPLEIIAETLASLVDEDLETHLVEELGPYPLISARMVPVFHVRFQTGGSALVVRRTGSSPIEYLVDSTQEFRDFAPRFAINREGDLLFTASIDPRGHPDRVEFHDADEILERAGGDPAKIPAPTRRTSQGTQQSFHRGVFFDGTDGVFEIVGGTDREFADIEDGVAMNDGRLVAYRALDVFERATLFLSMQEGQKVPIVTTGPAFRELGAPSIDTRGRVYFRGTSVQDEQAIYQGTFGQGQPQAVLPATAAHAGFDEPIALSELGDLAVVARGPDGSHVLLVRKSSGVVTEYLRTGAVTATGKVDEIRIGPRAFAGPRRLAVHVTLVAPEGEAILLVGSP